NFKIAYSISNTSKSLITRGKDKPDPLANHNVVYKISYEDCEASYVYRTNQKKIKNKIKFSTTVDRFNHTFLQTPLSMKFTVVAGSDTRIGKFIASTRARGPGIVELIRFVSSSLDLDTRR
ncbi:hypothetical protein ALC57_07427, partial [Trachymyrmex cornetzi]